MIGDQREKKIVQRDNFKCIKCNNKELIKDCEIGQLFFLRETEKGSTFNFLGTDGNNSVVNKKVIVRKDALMDYMPSNHDKVAFVDLNDIDDSKFIRVIGIIELETLDYFKWNKVNSMPGFYYFMEKYIFSKMPFTGLNRNEPGKLSWKYVSGLHVHHSYYQKNLLPWEYPDSSLQTLCWVCHEKFHKDQSVPFLDENGMQFNTLMPCSRCYGAGWFPQYKHIQDGVCFECWGAKYIELIPTNYKFKMSSK